MSLMETPRFRPALLWTNRELKFICQTGESAETEDLGKSCLFFFTWKRLWEGSEWTSISVFLGGVNKASDLLNLALSFGSSGLCRRQAVHGRLPKYH